MLLNTFVKNKKNIATGGQAKLYIRSGKVIVNNVVETRNKLQLKTGDVVVLEGVKYTVE